jgi:hypothetical protein
MMTDSQGETNGQQRLSRSLNPMKVLLRHVALEPLDCTIDAVLSRGSRQAMAPVAVPAPATGFEFQAASEPPED